jgi:hypothetical protein
MSFPDPGVAIPANDSGTSISLSQLRTSWGAGADIYSGGSDPGSTNLSISEFDNANFSDGTSIDADGSPAVTIGTHFCGKTFLIPVTGVTLAVSDTTPDESTTVSSFATATIAPSNANGTITLEFTTVSSGGTTATPATTGYASGSAGSNTMNYTFGAVTSNTNIGGIQANVKQNGGSVVATDTSGDITIQETGGGGRGGR